MENPAMPLAKNAGRVLALTEVWRITDDAGDFFLTGANNLQIADNGSIFLAESKQFLKFSPDGKFVKDLYKKGQGPGEWPSPGAFGFGLRGKDLFIYEPGANRCWRADEEGRLQEEIDLPGLDYPNFVGVVPGGVLFLNFTFPPRSEWTGKSMDLPVTLVEVATGGASRKARDAAIFPSRIFVAPHRADFDMLVVKPSPDGSALYVFNGWDYRIDVLDPVSGAAVKTIKRDYPKARLVLTEAQEEDRRKNDLPKYDYRPDIQNLYPTSDHLWVETSSEDKAKGVLYDVFDKGGRFIDSFYLGAGKTLMAVREGVVFCQEKREDDALIIVKYRVGK